jgi:hypothetical protein
MIAIIDARYPVHPMTDLGHELLVDASGGRITAISLCSKMEAKAAS